MKADYEAAHTALAYDPLTGALVRKHSAGNVAAGAVCGSPDTKGYLRTHFNGKRYKNHRIAWLMHYGTWPLQQLDHINGDKQDNRIENLRECSTAENCINQHGPRNNNSIGYQGVHVIKKTGRFRAVLRGKHLGCFSTPELAHQTYLHAKQEYLP